MKDEILCVDCSDALSAAEIRYYGERCETCEGVLYERIKRWKAGGRDWQLDRIFADERVVH